MKIQNVRVFDGRDTLAGFYDLYTDGSLIEGIYPHGSDHAHNGEVISGDGRWLMPGLIDLHVHLTWNGGIDPARDITYSTPEENLLETVSNALKYLPAGVTTVRDLGSPADAALFVSEAVSSGKLQGPRIFASGMSLIMTGGHDPFHGLPVDGPWEALKGVRTQVKKGAKIIKISATGGVYGRETGESVDDTELRPEELAMIMDEAHRRNIPVTAHAIGEQGIRACLKAGIDCIEHGHYIQPDMARMMAEQHTALVPTIFIYRHLAADPDIPEYARMKSIAVTEQHQKALNYARESGVLIGAGSDAGSPTTPHPSLADEVAALNEGGLSAAEALSAATYNAGRILKMDGRLGIIAEGAFADLILLKGDPTEDLSVLKCPDIVIADGKIVKR